MDEVLKDGNRQRVVEHSPQLPQGFTAVSKIIFWPGQRLEATCQFNSMERDDITWAGATHHHEMCNLYMITWSEMPVFLNCYDSFTSMDYHGAGVLSKLWPSVMLQSDCDLATHTQSKLLQDNISQEKTANKRNGLKNSQSASLHMPSFT